MSPAHCNFIFCKRTDGDGLQTIRCRGQGTVTTLSYQAHDPAHRYRGIAVVIGLHLLLAWGLISGTAHKTLEILKKPLQAVVIQEVSLPPPPPPPAPKEIRPPEPLAPKVTTPPPVVQDAPVPSAARPMESVPEPVPPSVKPMPSPPVVEAPVAPVIEQPKVPVASLEGEYLAKIRAMLNANKRYPTGRQASQQRPYGSVKVWFTLARNGGLVEAGVLESSNSNLLDDAALASVRRGTYPAFPEHTWPGEAQHKFSADIEFSPPSAG